MWRGAPRIRQFLLLSGTPVAEQPELRAGQMESGVEAATGKNTLILLSSGYSLICHQGSLDRLPHILLATSPVMIHYLPPPTHSTLSDSPTVWYALSSAPHMTGMASVYTQNQVVIATPCLAMALHLLPSDSLISCFPVWSARDDFWEIFYMSQFKFFLPVILFSVKVISGRVSLEAMLVPFATDQELE